MDRQHDRHGFLVLFVSAVPIATLRQTPALAQILSITNVAPAVVMLPPAGQGELPTAGQVVQVPIASHTAINAMAIDPAQAPGMAPADDLSEAEKAADMHNFGGGASAVQAVPMAAAPTPILFALPNVQTPAPQANAPAGAAASAQVAPAPQEGGAVIPAVSVGALVRAYRRRPRSSVHTSVRCTVSATVPPYAQRPLCWITLPPVSDGQVKFEGEASARSALWRVEVGSQSAPRPHARVRTPPAETSAEGQVSSRSSSGRAICRQVGNEGCRKGHGNPSSRQATGGRAFFCPSFYA